MYDSEEILVWNSGHLELAPLCNECWDQEIKSQININPVYFFYRFQDALKRFLMMIAA